MSWGTGPWGAGSAWGTGLELPPPSVVGVSSDPGPLATAASPASVDFRGGTVCTLVGTNFFDPTVIEILTGGPGTYVVVGQGYVFDPTFDLTPNRIYFGSPPLDYGTYHLRVTTGGGTSNVLTNVIESRRFAEEFKTLSSRGKFSAIWETGPRLLTNELIGLDIP